MDGAMTNSKHGKAKAHLTSFERMAISPSIGLGKTGLEIINP
jgi:hypothetical protein